MLREPRLWPVTVFKARYAGQYEGGVWVAFHCEHFGVPNAAIGDDVTAYNFWNSGRSALVGRGRTPDEAVTNLVERLEDATGVEL